MSRSPTKRGELRTAPGRLAAIAPLLEYVRLANGRRYPAVRLDGREFRRVQDVAQWRAAQLKISERTLWRWLKRFKRGGYDALADGRCDKGRSLFFVKHKDHAAFVCSQFPRVASALAILETMRCEEFRPLPSISTLRAFLKTLPRPRGKRARLKKQALFFSQHPVQARFVRAQFPRVRTSALAILEAMRRQEFCPLPSISTLRGRLRLLRRADRAERKGANL